MKLGFAVLAGVMFALPVISQAQVAPIFGGTSLFEPEIDIVNSGAILDAQATVSHDRKYVTMTLRPQNSQLLALRTFAFQTPGQVVGGGALPGGMIGGVNPVIPGTQVPAQVNPPRRLAPGHGGAILLSRGITPLILK